MIQLELTASPLIWFGGKSKLAKHIIQHMPPHRCYVELFGGAAHVLVQKPPAPIEVYNDIDGELVNFLMVVRENPEKFANAADSLPYSRALFEQWKRETPPSDPFERAIRFFYFNRSGIAKGNSGYAKGWRHGKDVNPARAYHSAVSLIKDFAQRFRNVQIECQDFRKIIDIYDSSETLFFVDPPYVGREQCYAGGFGAKEHEDLAARLRKIKGRAIITYNRNDFVEELYKDWRKIILPSSKQVVGHGTVDVQEVMFLNFRDKQLTIFDLIGW